MTKETRELLDRHKTLIIRKGEAIRREIQAKIELEIKKKFFSEDNDIDVSLMLFAESFDFASVGEKFAIYNTMKKAKQWGEKNVLIVSELTE